MKRLLITGDRNWLNREIIRAAIEEHAPDLVIQGGAKGADTCAYDACVIMEIDCLRAPAKWTTGKFSNKKAAGPIRNGEMLKLYNPHVVLAFNDDIFHSRGTYHMIKIAVKAGIETHLYVTKGEKHARVTQEVLERIQAYRKELSQPV